MWTGRQTLVSIESAIAKLHGEEGQLDQALRSAVSDADRLRKERSQGLRELARIKLDEMTAARLVSNLDAGERRAMQILDDYRMRMAATTEQREALLKEVAGAEAERNAAAAEVETALGVVETLRVQAEAKVQTTPEWRAAKTMRDEADAVATEAERKATGAEAELGAKKKPYDDDPLFAYLWRRDFGTSAYTGGSIASAIDRIVADFIDFSECTVQLQGADRDSAAPQGACDGPARRGSRAAHCGFRHRAAGLARTGHRRQGKGFSGGAPQAGRCR